MIVINTKYKTIKLGIVQSKYETIINCYKTNFFLNIKE